MPNPAQEFYPDGVPKIEAHSSIVGQAFPISKPLAGSSDRQSERLPLIEWKPFPVDTLAEPVRTFVLEAAAALGCDPTYIALPALAAVAAAIGTTRRIRLKRTWAEPSVVWAAIVGLSGSMKSPAMDHALQPLRDWEAEQAFEYNEAMGTYRLRRLQYDVALRDWKNKKDRTDEPPEEPDEPHMQRVTCADVTVEALATILENNARGILCARDELRGWFGAFDRYHTGRGSDISQWLEFFRAGPLLVDRKTGERRVIHVPFAGVGIVGSIQPAVLGRAFGREHFEDGLASRLLMAMPPRKEKKWTEAELSEGTRYKYRDVLDQLLTLRHDHNDVGHSVPVDVPLSKEAKALWISFFGEHAERQAAAFDADVAAAFSKLEAYAARFALLFHFVRWAASPTYDWDTIQPEAIQAGADLTRWFCDETERLYRIYGEGEADQETRELIEYIRSKGGKATARDLMRGRARFKVAKDATEALEALVAGGWAVWESPRSTPAGGRPKSRVRLIDITDIDKTFPRGAENDGFVTVNTVNGPGKARGAQP